MFRELFEFYQISKKETGAGYGTLRPNPAVGLSDGSFPIYVKYDDDIEEEDSDDDDIETVDIHPKIGGYTGVKDVFGSRKDNASFVSNSRLNLAEKVHTNPIRPGISPYKMKKITGMPVATGGAGQAFRTTSVGVRTSGPYGNSRATYPRHDEDLSPLMFGQDIVNKYERALKKHQIKIKKIKNLLKELDS